jgi:hypothetical protein
VRSFAYRSLVMVFGMICPLFISNATAQLSTETVTETLPDWVGKLPFTIPANAELLVQEPDDYTWSQFQVKPGQADPFKTNLVQAAWLHGIGCPPANTRIVVFNNVTEAFEEATFTEHPCEVGDPLDSRIEGLLLAKTGPTVNFASAFARIIGVKGELITELGWDIRKAGGMTASPLGSHCGGGAPRWNIQPEADPENIIFIGCNSPGPSVATQEAGQAWIRQRWTLITPVTVRSLAIVFDEGTTDGGPDFFGAAILDNITINGVIVGRGAVNAK